jgi:hypothetical protein
VFLVLEVGGQLPGFFAYPAAFGDIAVGLTACVAVIALIWSTSTSIPIAWSVLGLLDFIGAVGTAFLATQALAVVHTHPPTSVFTQWPMVLFPAYLVPFSIILHITTIRVLLANRRRARDEHTSVATSAMTATSACPTCHMVQAGTVAADRSDRLGPLTPSFASRWSAVSLRSTPAAPH